MKLSLCPLWLAVRAIATRLLMATSLVTCMEKSQILPSYFNVSFDADDRSLRYNLDLTTEISGNVLAHVQIYAYGFVIIDRVFDMCNLGWKQFCPLYPGNLQIQSIEYLDKSVVDSIPGIAFLVPDIDAVVKVDVYDATTNERLSCLQSSFSNGRTVSQTGIRWTTAVIAGLGLAVSAFLSTFGNSNAASFIANNIMSLFLYFQSVVIVCMQSVDRVPPIVLAWSENLAWSMGLIEVPFMQKVFRWYIQSTGGSPTLYFKQTTQQILVQRSIAAVKTFTDYVANLPAVSCTKRDLSYHLNSNHNLIVLRGIKRVGFNAGIEPTSIVVTGFTFFVIFGFVLVALLEFVHFAIVFLVRTNTIKPTTMSHFRRSLPAILRGTVLKYVYIGFIQLVILSLWEFTARDSPAVIALAALTLLMSVVLGAYACWNTYVQASLSVERFNNPAAILYGDSNVLHRFGFIYTIFNAKTYWFGLVILGYLLVKGIFVGLCQSAGKISTVLLFVLDLAYTVSLFYFRPYMNKPTNILNYCLSIVITVNSFLFMFFSGLFGQPALVDSIMGWIFFILNAAFSLILLIMILVLVTLAFISKNPDSRFAPARDDRKSFQRMFSLKYNKSRNTMSAEARTRNELFALGAAAQLHQKGWEEDIYRQHDSSKNSDDGITPEMSLEKVALFLERSRSDDSLQYDELLYTDNR
ncbi:TRP-domain-containing protein [Metschnikowia bicuspidata]|uniref:TRP-domain-containing protein n=1 Tax=Metschnikowia bicuspidata TaxID=27322 RepID=A0A4P9ZEB0_9ASCO|nr:TRP-domain-containing protein [Metschnikowia bicuspidata]